MKPHGLSLALSSGDPLWFGIVLLTLAALIGWGVAFSTLRRLRYVRGCLTAQQEVMQNNRDEELPELPIDGFPGAVLLLDTLGALIQANREAVSQFGDSIGAILRHPAARGALSAALRAEAHAPEGTPPVCSTTFTLDVPIKRTMFLALRHIPSSKRLNDRILVVLTDRSEAHALDRMRIDFVTHASHELRTPLASLSGFIDALRNGGASTDDAVRQQFLDVMAQQSARMKRLIDRLLYLSRVQAHEHQKPQNVVEVSDLMALVLDEVAPRFEGEGYALNFDIEDDLFIHADEDELVQVMLNLIENALRYGKHDDKTLTVTLLARRAIEQDDRWPTEGGVVLSVKDDGRGMEAHHLPRLAERFYRVVNAEQAKRAQGSGLGLSIVRHIIDRHQGRMHMASAPNQGTSCLVWLPPSVGDVGADRVSCSVGSASAEDGELAEV
ncbi:sensor histidine kinase [Neokomagataea thailandica]|uniref:histidine kinase n=1 Tax=Neokomagataea tanensis NBRC 106556 TaxID=1223519 RepID=A0ABQ0QG37_9PROT|nr:MULTISPECIES: ATP-binding protein [Neokomagataea]GBR43621.1 two component sensor histidine kinase PhoR [Neokomagataea tanensis NBRC 106556]